MKPHILLSVLLWIKLQPGVLYKKIPVSTGSFIHVVKIDPGVAEFVALSAGEENGASLTAKMWAEKYSLAVVINAGMFDVDGVTHVGYMRIGDYVNSPRWVKSYRSCFAFGPLSPDVSPAVIVDVENREARSELLNKYQVVIQNLRLIKYPGISVWKPSHKRWSEAALAQDREGNILFIFSRKAYSMWEFNRIITRSPVYAVRAMHLEGGPEASLSINTDVLKLHLAGSYETGFNENYSVMTQWPIPNIIGVKKK